MSKINAKIKFDPKDWPLWKFKVRRNENLINKSNFSGTMQCNEKDF